MNFIDIKSIIAGIRTIKKPYIKPKPKWAIRLTHRNPGPSSIWWFHIWTPIWHKGRGPYISISIGIFAIYRGY